MSTAFKTYKNEFSAHLNAAVTDIATSFVLQAGEGEGCPTLPFRLTVDDEIVYVTDRTVDTLTVTRACESTAGTSHDAGATLYHNWTAGDATDITAAINGIEGGTTTLASVATSGAGTIGGSLAANGGAITTDDTTFALLNTTATTVNAFGASAATTVGAATGHFTVNNATTNLNSTAIVSDETTVALLNTTTTTLNFGGAATTMNIGAAAGTVALPGALTVGDGYGATGATISTAGVGQFNGALTTDGAITADSATIGGGYGSTGCTISNAGVLQLDGAATIGGGLFLGGNIVLSNTPFNVLLAADSADMYLDVRSSSATNRSYDGVIRCWGAYNGTAYAAMQCDGTTAKFFSHANAPTMQFLPGNLAADLQLTATDVTVGSASTDTFQVTGPTTLKPGATAAACALRFSTTTSGGLEFYVIDEVVSLAGNAAKFKALTNTIPAGAVILSVQGNIQTAVTGGGTTATISFGLNASAPNKYGTVNAGDSLAQNAKLNKLMAWTVLSSAEQIDVCGCVSGGATLGDTNITAGSVRVRIVYLAATSLANA